MTLLALTADGKKVAELTGSASADVPAGGTATVSVPVPLGILGKKLAVLGVTSVSLSAGVLVGFTATVDRVDVTVYNPGTAAATVTVSVRVVVLGV